MNNDREVLAVLVALEPLDDRKWAYLDLGRRTFEADAMLDQPWSSGERALIQVAASLWNTGTVDLGYIATALGGRHLQAILDATAIRAGHNISSNTDLAIRRIGRDQSRGRASVEVWRGAYLDQYPPHLDSERLPGLEQ